MLPLTTQTASEAFRELRDVGGAMRALCVQLRAQIDAGTVYPQFVRDVLAQARHTLQRVPVLAEVEGLGDHIRRELARPPEFDLTEPLNQSLGALAALVGAVVAEYPRDPETGRMLDSTLQPDGSVVWATIPAASMQQTGAAVDAFLATLA